MKALITGASSGIGKDMAHVLSNMGYDLILVSRSMDALEKVKKGISTNVNCIALDLSDYTNCVTLHKMVKEENIDILINNAGYGLFGSFDKSSLKEELNMIDLNIGAVHILTKLFLKDFKEKNHGYILNVASLAAFQAGPLMATYYASKAYVLRLTTAIYEELRRDKSNVVISALCPGPVATNFNKVAKVSFSVKPLKSIDVAEYGIKQMFKKKLIIIPGFKMKIATHITRLVPIKWLLRLTYDIQKKKED
jgi:uncharacterized protein